MRYRPSRIAVLFAMALSLAAVGCGQGDEVNASSLRKARLAWNRSKIRNYDLEWITTGPQTSPSGDHYAVAVRDGEVTSIDRVRPDGKRFRLRPARANFYGMEGLFLTMEEELAQLKTDTPFNAPKGTDVILRFTTDPTLGYVKSYRRDILTQSEGTWPSTSCGSNRDEVRRFAAGVSQRCILKGVIYRNKCRPSEHFRRG